jgi:hypothetical protein
MKESETRRIAAETNSLDRYRGSLYATNSGIVWIQCGSGSICLPLILVLDQDPETGSAGPDLQSGISGFWVWKFSKILDFISFL